MSTSILYHTFGVREYWHVATEYREGETVFHLEKAPEKQWCSECQSREVIKKGAESRLLRTLPVGSRRVWLHLHLHRLQCRSCGALKLEPLLIADAKCHYTRALARYVCELSRWMTLDAIARHLGLQWKTVRDIVKKKLQRELKKRSVKGLKYLGVDEVTVGRWYRFMTVVVDLESGEVVHAQEGRDENALSTFLKRLKKAGVRIEAFALDMWRPYIAAIREQFPRAKLVFDRYHVMAQYGKLLDELRRLEYATASREDKTVFKGIRYLLLKGKEKLTDNAEAQAKLQRLFTINEPLTTAYLLKEQLRSFWACSDRVEARRLLTNWFRQAVASGIKLLRRFAEMLFRHRYGLFSYFRYRISTGPVEGINNKIKVLKRQAYGYRDIEFFKLRVLFIRRSRYALVP